MKRMGILSMTARLLRIASPVKGELTISTLASIVGNLAQVGLMGSGAALLLHSGGLMQAGTPLLWGALLLISSVAIAVCRYTEGYVSHGGAYKLLADMRVNLFDTLRELAPACLMDRQKGDILSVAVSDIETIEFFFAHTIGPLFTVILLPVVTLCVAAWSHPLYAVALAPVYLVVSVALPLISIKTGRKIGRAYRERNAELKSLTIESVAGLREIQIFRAGQRRIDAVTDKTRQINKAAHALTMHRQLVTSAPVFFIYLARILVIAVSSYLAISGLGDPVGVILLSFVVAASFSSTQSLTMVITSLLETYAAAERIFALEDAQPEVVEADDPVELGAIECVEFDNVSFRYQSERAWVLDRLNLTIRAGDKVGVVGESGIGKSTIIRLLLRFWEPDSGEIRINGIPLKRISFSSLRARIAMLEQDTFLFNDTIAANISMGRPEISREEIISSAKRAQIHELIQSLPEGYQTQMGELGGRLSGGEKQRIGIARAMLTNPDILVMDEPTSNLDALNEKGLLKTLEDEYADKTLMIVSHRTSTLIGCNRIIRMQGGKIIEESGAALGA